MGRYLTDETVIIFRFAICKYKLFLALTRKDEISDNKTD
jgi:hypothetical protein